MLMRGISFVLSLLMMARGTKGQICSGISETMGASGTFPSFDHSAVMLFYKTNSLTQCQDACKRTTGCKSYYFGTDYICGEKKLGCTLFPAPFQPSTRPITGATVFSSASSTSFGVSANRGCPVVAGGAWWFSDSTGLALTAPKSANTASACRDTCLANPVCKSWSYSLYDDSWHCEHFKVAIHIPSAAESWKNFRSFAPAGYGGYSANVFRTADITPPGCSDADLKALYDAHDACQLDEFQSTGQLTLTKCAATAKAALDRVSNCLVAPAGIDMKRFAIGAANYTDLCSIP